MLRPGPRAAERDVTTSSALTVTFTHPQLSNEGMMMLGSALELMELRADADGEPLKDSLVVDLMESQPKSATVKITPKRPLTYEEIMEGVRYIAEAATEGILGQPLNIGRILWETTRYGVPSDQKSNLRSI